MKNIIILVFLCALLYAMFAFFRTGEIVDNEDQYQKIIVLKHWHESSGNGVYVKLQVKNYSDKEAKFISYNIQSLDENNTILSSGDGTVTNVKPLQSAIIDRYFTNAEWKGYYEFTLGDITY